MPPFSTWGARRGKERGKNSEFGTIRAPGMEDAMTPRLPQMPFPQNWDDGSQAAFHAVARMRVSAIAVPLCVSSPTFTAPALSQNQQRAVIELARLLREFSALPYLQEFRWWFIAWLIYPLCALAITDHGHVVEVGCNFKPP